MTTSAALNHPLPAPANNGRPETAAAGPDDILVLDRVSRRFGNRKVLDSIDLTLGSGERVALRGPNGSGKTTLLRCVTGTLTPSGGEIRVGGHEAGSVEARQLVGASLSQERAFYMRLTGHHNLLFFARLRHGTERAAQREVRALEEELELSDIAARRADSCSSGMLQQLALARALLGEPRLLVLDEPTRSLDKDAVERLWGALDQRPELAVLIATHREEDLAHCSASVELSA
jgi:ABC-type multidrug transport system ATPase subunit